MEEENGSHGLKLLARINLGIEGVNHQLKEQGKKWAKIAKGNQQPILSKIPWSGICNSSGFGVFFNTGVNTEGPDQGHIWFVRHITVQGLTVAATTAGRFDVFISAMDYPNTFTSLAQFTTADWFDGSNTIPNSAFYGRGECPLRMSESLTFVVSGASANQNVGGIVIIEDFLEAAIGEEWGL